MPNERVRGDASRGATQVHRADAHRGSAPLSRCVTRSTPESAARIGHSRVSVSHEKRSTVAAFGASHHNPRASVQTRGVGCRDRPSPLPQSGEDDGLCCVPPGRRRSSLQEQRVCKVREFKVSWLANASMSSGGSSCGPARPSVAPHGASCWIAVTLKFRSRARPGSRSSSNRLVRRLSLDVVSKCVGPTAVLGALDRVVEVASGSRVEASGCQEPSDPHPATAMRSRSVRTGTASMSCGKDERARRDSNP